MDRGRKLVKIVDKMEGANFDEQEGIGPSYLS
jgi:hypothetical protein